MWGLTFHDRLRMVVVVPMVLMVFMVLMVLMVVLMVLMVLVVVLMVLMVLVVLMVMMVLLLATMSRRFETFGNKVGLLTRCRIDDLAMSVSQETGDTRDSHTSGQSQ